MNFLTNLQNAPHEVKMRWLIALSIVAFAIVLIIWLAAFPAMVAIAPPASEANPNPGTPSGAASIFDTFFGK